MESKKKKVGGKPTRTRESVTDPRFAHLLQNPIYRPVPRKEKKVEIDGRFQAMFKDSKFKVKSTVDKRGRPVIADNEEDMRRYYNMEGDEEIKEEPSSSESSDSDEDIDGDVKEDEIKTANTLKIDQVTRKKLHSQEVDYARGEGDLEETSSEDEDSSEDDEVEMLEHDWGELDKDADRTESSTRRLALCNMDWDRVRAVDLMVLLSSFLPAGGTIEEVAIYPSEFGKERMKEEDREGPKELKGDGDEEDFSEEEQEGSGDSDEDGEGGGYHRERLRRYQLNRLKYFYAVAAFDSVKTAEAVYSECDGMEYESSAAKVDLRFIPDDVTFDEDVPREKCTEMPDKYKPRFFTTTALQQVKVELTWDETEQGRKDVMEGIWDPKGNVEDDDIKAYLATSSEEEDEDEVDEEDEKKYVPEEKKVDMVEKYRMLLGQVEKEEKKKKSRDCEMEVTWGVGLKEGVEGLVKKKIVEDSKKGMTPWEERLDKRREKRQQRKQKDDEEDAPFSDDDVDVDMDDEFFKSEIAENELMRGSVKSKKKGEKKPKEVQEEDTGKSNAELELLLMDEDSNKKHFSLKKIIEEENPKKKNKKKKLKKKAVVEEKQSKDDFEINVEDNRFSALFSSHHYNVDPSDPNFKKTKAMERIIAEKQKRRETQAGGDKNPPTKKRREDGDGTSKKKDAELSYLVKSIKRNTKNLKMNNGKFKNKK